MYPQGGFCLFIDLYKWRQVVFRSFIEVWKSSHVAFTSFIEVYNASRIALETIIEDIFSEKPLSDGFQDTW